jgi:hypothetical protein
MIDDDEFLRAHARRAVLAGHLPDRLPDRVWAGPATTGRCAICGGPTAGQVEFEMVFTDEWQAVVKSCCVHSHCLKAFERTVQGFTGPSASRTDAAARIRPAPSTEPPE